MSRSYKKNLFKKVSSMNTYMKKVANKTVREYDGDLPKGSLYKKLFKWNKFLQNDEILKYESIIREYELQLEECKH